MDARERALSLPYWLDAVEPIPLQGGITNTNFLVNYRGERFAVRIGADIPAHGVMRFNELAASQAAYRCGLSPEVVYAEEGAMIIRFIEGKTLTEEDIRQDDTLQRILPLLRRCHWEMPRTLRGPILTFSVFYVLRDYSAQLREYGSRMLPQIPRFLEITDALEEKVGRIRLCFGHNDLLAANLIDDGERLWLIDWDYAGFTSPLFDLSNLASNNLLSQAQERWLLEAYYHAPVDTELWHRYNAMKCASLLREAMWSMVSEHRSTLDFDYIAYSEKNLARFEDAFDAYQSLIKTTID
jgi:thiamine kinase-like enzyme